MNDHAPDNASVPSPAAATNEPAELTTIVDLLSDYAAAGYDTELSVTVDARVHCKACGEDTAAVAMQLDSLRRIEGASDPDDMQVVVALVCQCGAKAPSCSGTARTQAGRCKRARWPPGSSRRVGHLALAASGTSTMSLLGDRAPSRAFAYNAID